MTTFIIIIAVLSLAAAAVLWLTRERKKEDEGYNEPSVKPADPADGWRLDVTDSGRTVRIGDKDVKIRNIVLTRDDRPVKKCSYTVRVRFSFMGGENEQTFSGTLGLDDMFDAGGRMHYGAIITGAPEAKVISKTVAIGR